MENNEVEQQNSSYMATIESNVNIKPEEIDIKLEKFDFESPISIKKEYWCSEIEGDFNVVDNVKQESTNIDENQFDVKNEAWDIENQQTALTSTVIKSGSPVAVLSSNSEGGHTLVHQNTLENITSTFEISPHNSKCIPNQRKRKSPKNNKSHKALLKCEQCSHRFQSRSKLLVHMCIRKDPSELNMYKCSQCNFKTKYKYSLKLHSILHKDAADIPRFICKSCGFETKRKSGLIKHLKRHQKTSRLNSQEQQKPENITNSEKVMFKCEQCSYGCNQLSRLHLHVRTHKDPSELNMYECTQCNFKTKHKKSLKNHSFRHKDPTEVPSYKCNSCGYETIIKDNLRKHIGTHQKISRLNNQEQQKPENTTNSEKVLLKCEQCSYECPQLHRLYLHMRIHKDPSEINMYECTQCDFKTKHARSLRYHSNQHKDPAELPSYKCNYCGYEMKRKDVLRKHIARHQKYIQAEQPGTTETRKYEEFEEVLFKCE